MYLFRAGAIELMPAAVADCSVHGFRKSVSSDYTNARLAMAEVRNQGPEERESDCKRCGPVNGIYEPEMLRVSGLIAAKFLSKNCMSRVSFRDTLPQKLLRATICFRDLRSVGLMHHGDMLPER